MDRNSKSRVTGAIDPKPSATSGIYRALRRATRQPPAGALHMTRLCSLLFALLLFATPVFAQSSAATPGKRGDRAAVPRVIRFDTLPRVTAPSTGAVVPIDEGEVPIGEEAMETTNTKARGDRVASGAAGR